MTLSPSRILTISRPRFWVYEFGSYILGICAGAFSLEFFATTDAIMFGIFFLFPANLFIYGVNDIFDYETDLLNPKKTSYEALLTPSEHKTLWFWILFTTIPFAALALYHYPLHVALSFLIFLFFAFFYSAKPIQAKTKPFLDSFFSAGHYIATAVFGYYLAGGLGFPLYAVLAGMAWAIAMHAYSAALDIEADKNAGLQTIATLLNKKGRDKNTEIA